MSNASLSIALIKSILENDKDYQSDILKVGAIWNVCTTNFTFERTSGRSFYDNGTWTDDQAVIVSEKKK